jgi:hypothetical protein
VRFYRTTQIPKKHPQDPASWRDLGQRQKPNDGAGRPSSSRVTGVHLHLTL